MITYGIINPPPVFSARRANGGNATAEFRVNQWLFIVNYLFLIVICETCRLFGIFPLNRASATGARANSFLEVKK